MTVTARRDRHEALMTRMATTLGLDLEARAMAGALPPEAFEARLDACLSCTQSCACGSWLDSHAQADAAPAYCRNRDDFRLMKS